MIILNKNISVEENIDDLLYNNNIQVIEYDGFDKVTALSFVADGEKYVALKSCLDEDLRVLAKMHEFEHHKLNLFYTLTSRLRDRERIESRVNRELIEDFLTPKFLCRLIRRENTFNPRILAEYTNFSPDLIEYAEHLYFDVQGIEPPDIEDAYNE